MFAVGNSVITTFVVTGTAAQPALAGAVYVTTYAPAVLVLGVIAPVFISIVKPTVELYSPPVNAPVPAKVTASAVTIESQKGVFAYDIVAVGSSVISTVVVAITWGHPPAAAKV